jgi:predicted NUDIX family phosphoesterase
MKKALCIKYDDVFKVPRAELHSENIISNPISILDKPVYLLDRKDCETDLNYLQIIPYITLVDVYTSEIFVYKRGGDSGEKRLIGEVSIGLGGHIEESPINNEPTVNVIIEAIMRELNEEVGLPINDSLRKLLIKKFNESNFGCFYCNEKDVDKVHLALSLIISIPRQLLGESEKGIITNGRWLSVEELKIAIQEDEVKLENWSKLVFNLIETKLVHNTVTLKRVKL